MCLPQWLPIETDSLICLEPTNQTKQADGQAPGIFLALSPQCWNCMHAPLCPNLDVGSGGHT